MSLNLSLRLLMLKLLRKDSIFSLGQKIIATLSANSVHPHILLSLSVGELSTWSEKLNPIPSFKSNFPATLILYVKLFELSAWLHKLQTAVYPTVSHISQLINIQSRWARRSAAFFFIYNCFWKDRSEIGHFIVLLAVFTHFILRTCLPEIDGRIGPKRDDFRASWNSSFILKIYSF